MYEVGVKSKEEGLRGSWGEEVGFEVKLKAVPRGRKLGGWCVGTWRNPVMRLLSETLVPGAGGAEVVDKL
jgi:hypothetical protein